MATKLTKAERVTQLMNSRKHKKGVITKRINEMSRIVADGGSRRQLKYLIDQLAAVRTTLHVVCDELATLDPDADMGYADKEDLRVDSCIGDAEAYLDRRRDDPPSTESLCDDWLQKHAAVNEELGSVSDTDSVSDPLKGLGVQDKPGPSVSQFLNPAHSQWPQRLFNNDPPLSGTQPSSLSVNQPVFVPQSLQPQHDSSGVYGASYTSPRVSTSVSALLGPGQGQRSSHQLHSQLGGVHGVSTSANLGYVQGQPPLHQHQHTPSYTNLHQHNLHRPPPQLQLQPRLPPNQWSGVDPVDSWIDVLTVNDIVARPDPNAENEIAMGFFIQQSLPRLTIPVFDGSPLVWLEFVSRFKDLVHDQPYLTVLRKSTLLLQHLDKQAKRSVQGYPRDANGYVTSLKRLKFLFGQKDKIAQAVLLKITQGKEIQDNDDEGLSELYYSISDCLVTLKQLDYASDMYSSGTLRQVVLRLPIRMQHKWADVKLRLRTSGQDPSLIDLESWLQNRVLARRESYRPEKTVRRSKDDERQSYQDNRSSRFAAKTDLERIVCAFCQSPHLFWKCTTYTEMSDVDKYRFAKKNKLCFNCLRSDHIKDCPSKISCPKPGCSDRHHSTLHGFFSNVKEKSEVKKEKDDGDSAVVKDPPAKIHGLMVKSEVLVDEEKCGQSEEVQSSAVKSRSQDVFMCVVPVTIRSLEGVPHETYALLDNACTGSVMRDSVIESLHTQSEDQMAEVGTMKDEPECVAVRETTVFIESRDGSFKHEIKDIVAVPSDRFKMPSQPPPPSLKDTDFFTHLDDIDLHGVDSSKIEILIGVDVAEAFIPKEVRRGRRDQPLAIKTIFGWTLLGTNNSNGIGNDGLKACATTLDRVSSSVKDLWLDKGSAKKLSVNATFIRVPQKSDLEGLVQSFTVQEHTGILQSRDVAMSVEDAVAAERLKTETKLVDGRYVVPMLWHNPAVQLLNNLPLAHKRWTFLKKRFRSDPELYKRYKQIIHDLVSSGKARYMSEEESRTTSPKTSYLPHHPVWNAKKPDKIRVVNDGAAEYKGTSLNKSLVTGPDLLNSLVGVLMNFRIGPVALVADVEAMFHQVRVPDDDADSLRFLWSDDIESDRPPRTLQMLVHIFGAKDSLTCAIHALQQTARDNINKYSAAAIEAVLRFFYVDDILKSNHSPEAAIALAKELIDMLHQGGFRLTKWISNSADVLKALPPSEISPKVSVELDSDINECALGIVWDVIRDYFIFRFNPTEVTNTKRGILRLVSSLFDPLGFLTPFIVVAKILLQMLWREDLGWDDEISGAPLDLWRRWLLCSKDIPSFEVPRCYLGGREPRSEIQLHLFCDASESAYGTVAYLRFTLKTGAHQCAFVMSKSKLAPIKTITLPRLELSAAVTAARMSRLILHELDLPISKTFFWSDSVLTLQYISNTTNRFKVFVANKVSEILELSDKSQWGHIAGKENPADLLTRGVKSVSSLMTPDADGGSWLGGPAFLQQDEEAWGVPCVEPLDVDDVEIKRKSILVALSTISKRSNKLDVMRFSSWVRLKRVAGWLLRAVQAFKDKKHPQSDELTVGEIHVAEKFLVREAQSVAFEKEIRCLKAGKEIPPRSQLASLSPFIHMDILRVGGRLRRADISLDSKHPAILPKGNHITELVIMHDHRVSGHVGRDHVLSNLRQKYWIIHGKATVKAVLSKCFLCRVRRAKRMYPKMADLPEGRLAWKEPPFSHCGVDLFGPLTVKQGRKRLKRWGVIFTCLTVRAVHLEVVDSPDTDDFINATSRFVNRRGCPSNMYSDCGTNFKGATAELAEMIEGLDKKKIDSFAVDHEIMWHFNPPAAPHMGGVWERLVKSVKEVLYATMQDRLMQNRLLTDPQLATTFTEVEAILNNRPLTHASSDVNDLEALSPNHILLGLHRKWNSMLDTDETDVLSRRKWRQVQGAAHEFWTRWRKEYLPTLTRRARWAGTAPNYCAGELVLLREENPLKGKWELARVLRTMPADDGIVRVVELRTKGGVVLVRPVSKLARLEDD